MWRIMHKQSENFNKEIGNIKNVPTEIMGLQNIITEKFTNELQL